MQPHRLVCNQNLDLLRVEIHTTSTQGLYGETFPLSTDQEKAESGFYRNSATKLKLYRNDPGFF